MRNRKAIMAGLVCALMVVSSLGVLGTVKSVRAQDEIPTGGILRIGWLQEQDTLNPFVTNTVQGKMMLKLFYDTLLMWNKTLEPVGDLATSWTTSADGLTWTYALVQNAKWSDGQALKASDVKFTFDMVKDLHISAFYDQVKYMSSVTTNGDYSVTVVYNTTVGTVGSDMTIVPIVPEHIWTGMTKDQILASTNDNPIGSGPFTLESWSKQSSVVVDSNKDYWGTAPYIDRAVFTYYSNTEALINAIKNGEIDMIPKELPATSLAVLNQETNIKVTTNTDLYYREISLNCNPVGGGNPTLRDVNVRQALAMATDKQTLADLVHLGYADPGSTIVQKAASYWWDSTVDLFDFNISAANAKLNASGYLDVDSDGIREAPGNASLELSYTLLVLSRWPEEMRTGQQLQTWWGQIGVELTVQSADANTINSFVYPAYNQDMFLWGYSGQPDPNFSLLIMLTAQVGDWNDCGWGNATYDAWYDEQATTTDPVARKAIIKDMQDMVYEQSPYLVLYYMTAKGAYRIDTFTGFVNMPTGLVSDVNVYTLREVHLIKATSTPAKTDYTPWVVAALAIIVAVVAIGFAMMKGKGKKGVSQPEQKPEAEEKK
jgi:peptide/nickel transport system substrate-binding protein